MRTVAFVIVITLGGCGSAVVPWNITFEPGIDVGACRDGLQWSSQNVSPDADGHVDETWAPNEPDTARIVGDLTDDAFTATLSCLPAGAPSGTLDASRIGDGYVGTYTFDAQSGSIAIVAVE